MQLKTILIGIALSFFIAGTANGQESKKHHDFKEISEEEITYEELPEAVRTAFEKSEYKDWEIEEVEKVKTDKGTMYELEVENSDGKHMEVYFDPKGNIVATEVEEHKHKHKH